MSTAASYEIPKTMKALLVRPPISLRSFGRLAG
jgi:hypothetical protein